MGETFFVVEHSENKRRTRRRRNIGDNAYTRGLVKRKVGLVMVANTPKLPSKSQRRCPRIPNPFFPRPRPATPAFPSILSSASLLLSLTWEQRWLGGLCTVKH